MFELISESWCNLVFSVCLVYFVAYGYCVYYIRYLSYIWFIIGFYYCKLIIHVLYLYRQFIYFLIHCLFDKSLQLCAVFLWCILYLCFLMTCYSLRLFKCFNPFRILICSGDGSVGWVLSEIDKLHMTVSGISQFSVALTFFFFFFQFWHHIYFFLCSNRVNIYST